MPSNNWSARIPTKAAYARAGGRRRYHAERRAVMYERRREIAELFAVGCDASVTQRFLAGYFHVAPATINRDLQAIRAAYRAHEPTTKEMSAWYGDQVDDEGVPLARTMR